MGPGGASPNGRRRLTAVFIVYLAVVAFGVFGPAPAEPVRHAGEGVRRVADEIGAAVPGRSSDEVAGRSSGAGRDEQVLGGFTDEAIANTLMFIPFGVMFPLVFPRWRWWTVPAGVALTATIELIQLLFLSWRSASLEDVRWNSLGAAVGFGLWLAAWAARRRGRVA